MSGTWLDFCVVRRGPASKCGYPGVSRRTLAQIEGEVDHSMEGPLRAALGELDKLTRMASWTFSVPKVGPPLQHYALEDITWHCGLPGDRRTDTSLVGNLALVGIEHEDYPDNKLNANQLHWSAEITKAIRALCPLVGARPPLRRVNLWEHRELSATSCPSGLIPWDRKIALLEEDMDEATVRRIAQEEMAKPVPAPTGSAYLPYSTKLPGEFAGKWPTWSVWAFAQYLVMLIGRRDAALAAHAGQPHGGDGPHKHEAKVTLE